MLPLVLVLPLTLALLLLPVPDALCLSSEEMSDVDGLPVRKVEMLRCSMIGASSVPWPYRNGVSASRRESGDSALGSGTGRVGGGVTGLAAVVVEVGVVVVLAGMVGT